MPLTPSELEIMNQAADLLDALLTASGVYMTDTQKARAASEIETRLAKLRHRWQEAMRTAILDYLREAPRG
jgi:hypothetical protein